MVSLLAFLLAAQCSVLVAVAQTSTTPQPVYVGVPPNLNATYFQELSYVVVAGGKPVPASLGGSGGYNDSFTLIPQPYSSGGVVLQFPFEISIYDVKVSQHYNSTFAGKKPPQEGVLVGSEYTGNYSIAPYFIISPNAPTRNYTSSQLHIPFLNISVVRLSSFSYSHGEISFNGPAIKQTNTYQSSSSAGSLIVRNIYYYDAKSGLLIYWTNMTLYLLSGGSYVNVTSNVYLMRTNLNTINPSGSAATLQPSIPPTTSGQSMFSPIFIALLVVIVALVVVIVLAFARRRAPRPT